MNFFRRSVASITASLARMITDLEDHAASKLREFDDHKATAAKYTGLAADADAERALAVRTAEKIRGLLG